MERALRPFAILGLLTTVLQASQAVAAQETKTLALVVTNNRSTTLALPDLQYADDDGARYYRLFRSVADQDSVVLLTTFDRASAAAYPDLAAIARPPTQAAVEDAVVKLAAVAEAAHRRGDSTTFYFVYAGHGEVQNGRGTIDLEDGQIDGQFIERAIIEPVRAETKHIVLDSCNSFFVMNPRKPGGRRWATPKDMALGFGARHPEVGLFLSTNSDAEVYEWSELESGVFSHEVRSGLSGAADVDGDGKVSYSELAGFVDRANSRIVRDSLRPHIYFRGPNGESRAPLFSPAKAIGRRLVLGEGTTRLWIKSDTGERLLDLHKEEGALTVVLPGPANQAATIYVERSAGSARERPVVSAHSAPEGDGDIRLAELASEKPPVLARGDRLFASLFAEPFGKVAYRAFVASSSTEPEPVYGISDRDVTRMHNYIAAMAESDGQKRRLAGGILAGMGGVLMAASFASYADSPRWKGTGSRQTALIGAGAGALMVGGAIVLLSTSTSGELALRTFEKEASSNQSGAAAFAKTEQALEDVAKRDRRTRAIGFWLWEVSGVALAASATTQLLWPAKGDAKLQPSGAAVLFSLGALLITGGFVMKNIVEVPTERLLRLYRTDPDLKIRFGVIPTTSGGVAAVAGAF